MNYLAFRSVLIRFLFKRFKFKLICYFQTDKETQNDVRLQTAAVAQLIKCSIRN